MEKSKCFYYRQQDSVCRKSKEIHKKGTKIINEFGQVCNN